MLVDDAERHRWRWMADAFPGEWLKADSYLLAFGISLHASSPFLQAAVGVGGEVAVRLDVHG
jgi:hypothetical protein